MGHDELRLIHDKLVCAWLFDHSCAFRWGIALVGLISTGR